ncbi:MAG TPA: sugar transferase [Stellaceae bacterium]|nr:sugar transferase [Stellaceae bacterium]
MRRIGDLAIASALIALTLPLLAIVALVLKLDGVGPVLLREERRAGGRRMLVFKFCTKRRPYPGDPSRFPLQRPSQVGRFLRYTRIVDLPQLINVLRGEMSFVGNGAVRPDFFD